MKVVLAAAAAASALIAAPAFAQTGPVFTDPSFYVNLGVERIDGEEADVNGAVGRFGARLNRFVAVEGELAIGVGHDEVEVFGEEVEVKLDHSFAGYVVGFVPVSPQTDIFGRIGVGMVQLSAEALGEEVSDDVQTWNLGVGAQFFWDDRNGVRGEFTRLEVFDDEEFEDGINVWSIAYVRKFGG